MRVGAKLTIFCFAEGRCCCWLASERDSLKGYLDAGPIWSWLVERRARWMQILQTPVWCPGDPNRKSFGN